MTDASSGETSAGPTLPMFVQLNSRTALEDDDSWKEISRWVKFQEDVERGGDRWSKPHVPSCNYATMRELMEHLENGVFIMDSKATDMHAPGENTGVIDEVLSREPLCNLSLEDDKKIRDMFTENVKSKIKTRFTSQISSVAGSKAILGEKDEYTYEESPGEERMNQSAPASPARARKLEKSYTIDTPTQQEDDETPFDELGEKRRHFTVTFANRGSRRGKLTRQLSEATDPETLKLREINLFNKKLPKMAEAAIIQVAEVDFLDEIQAYFVRLTDPALIIPYCEVYKPVKFVCILFGPKDSGDRLQELGRALGTLFTDQLFCTLSAYNGKSKEDILEGIQKYTDEMTMLPAAAWNPAIRLDPPKSVQTVESRLAIRAESRKRHGTEGDELEEELEFSNLIKKEKITDHAKDDGLQFTGRLFGGLVDDVKRKLPWFVSDFTDAFHIQTIASIIYIYLATITKAITFGGFLGDITDGFQGVLESFLGHAIAGGVFCLLGGQPLTVLGCTGPVLIFEKILVDFCSEYGISYLTMRLWIGIWSSFFCLLIVAFDASAIVRYFTRFTEEAFAALVGIIFIVESFKKLFKMGYQFKVQKDRDPDQMDDGHCVCAPPDTSETMYADTPDAIRVLEHYNITTEEAAQGNWTYQPSQISWQLLKKSECQLLQGELEGHGCAYVPDIFFFSIILFFGTFVFCNMLKKFKFSSFFPTWVRSLVADYAVILTIFIFVMIDSYFGLATPKLIVPTVFKPTRADIRGWIIPLWDDNSPWYMYLLASIPALLLTILLFMDQQITSVIVNRKEHKLKKGAGYHLDMLIIGVMMGVCSILGLPWCVAATVLCLGHVDSLKMDTESSAPGETPQFLGVREQRVSGVMVFILTGLSVKLAPILKFIPMPVLYGVLLYMGVNTLHGMQFIDRILLMLMPLKYQPDYLYLRHVPLPKVHLFTLIQAGALALLWIIKSTPASLIFPLMVLALVIFRKLMDDFPSVFSQNDLFWLDNLIPAADKKKKSSSKGKNKKRKKDAKNNHDFPGVWDKEEAKEMLPGNDAA